MQRRRGAGWARVASLALASCAWALPLRAAAPAYFPVEGGKVILPVRCKSKTPAK